MPAILPRVTADLPRLCQTQHTVQLWSASVGPWRRTSGSSRLEPVSALDAAGLHTTNTPPAYLSSPVPASPAAKRGQNKHQARLSCLALPCALPCCCCWCCVLVLQKKNIGTCVSTKRAGAGFGTLDRRNRSMRPCSGPPPSRHAASAGWLVGWRPGCRPSRRHTTITPHAASRPAYLSSHRPCRTTLELCRCSCLVVPSPWSCVRDDQSFHHRTLTPVHARSLESAAL